MKTYTYQEFIEKASSLPYGLVVIAGPDRTQNTGTIRAIEQLIAERTSPVYRIGGPVPHDSPRIKHLETFKQAYENVEDIPEDKQAEELKRFYAWEKEFKFKVLANDPAAIIIQDLDQVSATLSARAQESALVGTLVVVSVVADSSQEAIEFILDASGEDTGYLLASALRMALYQWPETHSETGQEILASRSLEITDEVKATISSWKKIVVA